MKSYNTLLILVLSILLFSCKNDDDATIPEIDTSALIDAKASIASFSKLATIDLQTGTTITTQNDQLIASMVYEDSFIGLFPDRLVRSSETDFTGDLIWEYSFEILEGFERTFNSETVKIQGTTLYLTYSKPDELIPIPLNYIEAIDLTNGTVAWSVPQKSREYKRLNILNNTIITAEGPSNNTSIVSRNISYGSILNIWNLGERVSHLISGTNEMIVMSWSNAVYSIQEDLTLNWTFSTTGSNVQKGIIVSDQFVFHSRDENIYAVNLQTGDLNWSQAFPDLFIRQFFNNGTSIWSVTEDFNANRFVINELDASTGTILSNFNTPLPIAADDIDEIEVLAFSDYLLILMGRSGESTITEFYNYKTQNKIWQSDLDLSDIFTLRANVHLGTSRYAPTSF